MAPLWHQLAGQFNRRGLVIILSDCFDQIAPLMQCPAALPPSRHEVLLFHILAPEEIEFPFKKWTQFRNLEVRGHKLLVDPQRLRKEYLQELQGVLQGTARAGRQDAGRLSPDAHRRTGGSGPGHLLDETTIATMSRESPALAADHGHGRNDHDHLASSTR